MEVKSKETHTDEYVREQLIEKYFHILCYYNKDNGKIAALNLWYNGIQIFNGAKCIKDFESLKSIEFSKTIVPDVHLMVPFAQEQIIDYTRIITCYENFMKGCLILNGFISHKVNGKKHKKFAKEQVLRPVEIKKIFQESSFKHLNVQEASKQLEVQDKTVNFSWLLEPEYQKVIMLPSEIVKSLEIINEERNRLHFISRLDFELSKQMIKRIELLKNFVNEIMLPRTADMDSHQKKQLRSDVQA